MVANFRAREISRGARKLVWTPTSIKKNKLRIDYYLNLIFIRVLIYMHIYITWKLHHYSKREQ